MTKGAAPNRGKVYKDLPRRTSAQQQQAEEVGSAASTDALIGSLAGPSTPAAQATSTSEGAATAATTNSPMILASPGGTTMVLSREAPKLRFNVRGGERES